MYAQRCVESSDTNRQLNLLFAENHLRLVVDEKIDKSHYLGGSRGRGTPVPISNTEVKSSFADVTAVCPWESRAPPR